MYGSTGAKVVKDGQCLTLDEERILYEAGRCFERLLER